MVGIDDLAQDSWMGSSFSGLLYPANILGKLRSEKFIILNLANTFFDRKDH